LPSFPTRRSSDLPWRLQLLAQSQLGVAHAERGRPARDAQRFAGRTRLAPTRELLRRAGRTNDRNRDATADDFSAADGAAEPFAETTASTANHFRLRTQVAERTRSETGFGEEQIDRRREANRERSFNK